MPAQASDILYGTLTALDTYTVMEMPPESREAPISHYVEAAIDWSIANAHLYGNKDVRVDIVLMARTLEGLLVSHKSERLLAIAAVAVLKQTAAKIKVAAARRAVSARADQMHAISVKRWG